MRQKWILQAMVLGFAFFIAILLVKPIGVSTQFSVLSGKAHRLVHDAISDQPLITEDSEAKSGYSSSNAYYNRSGGKLAKAIVTPVTNDLAFFFSIFLGSFLAHLIFSRLQKAGARPLRQLWAEEKLTGKDIAISLLGGFLFLYGARMAGGCTSGHMMSGMMQSSVSGFIFALFVFALAIPVAISTEKKVRN